MIAPLSHVSFGCLKGNTLPKKGAQTTILTARQPEHFISSDFQQNATAPCQQPSKHLTQFISSLKLQLTGLEAISDRFFTITPERRFNWLISQT
jgi:hypothetical protein